jgi:hypothetical protein
VLFEGHQAGFPRIRTSVRNLLTTTYAHAFVSVPPVLLGSGVGAALFVNHLVAVLEVTLERCLGQAQFLALVVEQDSIPFLESSPGGGEVGHCLAGVPEMSFSVPGGASFSVIASYSGASRSISRLVV